MTTYHDLERHMVSRIDPLRTILQRHPFEGWASYDEHHQIG